MSCVAWVVVVRQQSVTTEFEIPVWSICRLDDLMSFVNATTSQPESNDADTVRHTKQQTCLTIAFATNVPSVQFGLTPAVHEAMAQYKQRYGACS